jgi:nucleotide-binding universal stress UspA family protein
LRWALDQARLTGGPVEAVISWRIPTEFMDGGGGALADIDWEGDARIALRDTVTAAAGSPDVDGVSQRVVMGHAATVLLDTAAGAALLVVGSRGRGGFAGMLLGSVSQHVVTRGTCPVVVVRAPEESPVTGSGRIVVGIDGSPHSEEALRWALDRSRLSGQAVEAVTSWHIPVNHSVGPLTALDWEGAASRTLQDVVARAVDADRVHQRVVKGYPVPVLLDAAADADLLVVGSRGRGGFAGMLLGSVSQHVVTRAACPVVVVRTPADAAAR